MKILMITHAFLPHRSDGAVNYSFHLASSLIRLKNDVLIVCPRFESNHRNRVFFEQYKEIPVIRFEDDPARLKDPINRYFNNKFDKQLGYILNLYNPAIVHINYCLEWLSVGLIDVIVRKKIPTVVTFHNYFSFCERVHLLKRDLSFCLNSEKMKGCVECFIDEFYPDFTLSDSVKEEILEYEKKKFNFMLTALDKIDLIVSPSKFLKDRFYIEDNQIGDKIKVIHTGIGGLPRPNNETTKRGNGITFGYLGTSGKPKGVHILLEAFEIIEGTYKLKIFERERNVLKTNNSHIRLCGSYSPKEINQVYADIDVVVVPSLSENYPLTILEALYYKKPVIASRVGGIPEIIKDGINGLLFEPGNARDLREKIEMFLISPELVKKIKGNIIQPKSSLEYAKEIEGEYRKLVKNSKLKKDRKSLKDEKANFLKEVNCLNFIKENVYWNGVSSFNKGKFRQAMQYFKKSLQIDDKSPMPHFYLGSVYSQQGKFIEAEEELKKALSLEPPDKNIIASIYYAMGSNYKRQGRPNEAIEKFNYVVNKEPLKFKGGSHFHLGCIYKELGKGKEAKHHFEECLKVIPEHKKARENQDALAQAER